METKPSASSIDPQHELPPASLSRKSTWPRLFVWAAILLTFGVIFFLVLHGHEETQSAAPSRHAVTGPVTVTIATAQKGNIGVYLAAIGTVTPVYTDSITSQVTGMVSKVHYQEGQLLRKDEALIDIDPRPFEAQLMQAEGMLESAINASQSYLPSNLPAPPVYSKTNPADAPILTLAITSELWARCCSPSFFTSLFPRDFSRCGIRTKNSPTRLPRREPIPTTARSIQE